MSTHIPCEPCETRTTYLIVRNQRPMQLSYPLDRLWRKTDCLTARSKTRKPRKRSETLGNTRKHSETLGNTRKPKLLKLGNTRKRSETLGNARKRSETKITKTRKHSETLGNTRKPKLLKLGNTRKHSETLGNRPKITKTLRNRLYMSAMFTLFISETKPIAKLPAG